MLPVFNADIVAMMHASINAPSRFRQIKSTYKTHTKHSGTILRSSKLIIPEFFIISSIKQDVTCAWSLGGPGRNLDEHNGGKSTFGIIYPCFGNSAFGLVNS